jgi:hypothetical protein
LVNTGESDEYKDDWLAALCGDGDHNGWSWDN